MSLTSHFSDTFNGVGFESKPDFEAADPLKWVGSYHFLFMDEKKILKNYSEDEVLFHLEIKGRKIK